MPKYLDWTAEQLRDHLIERVTKWSEAHEGEVEQLECLLQDIKIHLDPAVWDEEPDVKFGDTE
jgi:hypothetical protein